MAYTLSDEELMVLEMLTYMNDDFSGKSGINIDFRAESSIGQIFEGVSEKDLQALESKEFETASGKKWAAVIRELKNNPHLSSLVLYEQNASTYSQVYYYKDDPDRAIVVFQGTASGREWEDDAWGLGADGDCLTPVQRETVEYINGLEYGEDHPFSSITVAGHSKGGNKAQLVTLLCDKVDRCVSMDGQGFNKHFMDKYSKEIENKGCLITNYSLGTDYVHILMYSVPYSQQIYIAQEEGTKYTGLANHDPLQFFRIQTVTDSNGNQISVFEAENGVPKIYIGEEDPSMTLMHEFTIFALENMTDEELKEMGEFLGVILKLTCAKDGSKLSYADVYKLLNPDMAIKFFQYLVEFCVYYDLTDEEVLSLISMFTGLDKESILEWLENLTEQFNELSDICPAFDLLRPAIEGEHRITAILKFMKDSIEGKYEADLGVRLKKYIFRTLSDILGLGNGWIHLLTKTVKPVTINKNGTKTREAGNRKFNYSAQLYGDLTGAMRGINSFCGFSLSDLQCYSEAEWYGDLLIPLFIRANNVYFNNIYNINSDCWQQTDRIFGQVEDIDRRYAVKLQQAQSKIREAEKKARNIIDRLS